MNDAVPLRIDRGDGATLAYHRTKGDGPGIVFLPGYASDMTGSKALAVEAWARAHDRACLRFDYSGCGASEGDFGEASLDRWRDDALLMIDALTDGPQILVGSSMGGWIMLLAALRRPERIAGLVGIAAAPDFTDWGFTEEDKLTVLRDGALYRTSEYGPEPTLTTRTFWQSGEANRLLGSAIAIDAPVRLLHGQRDPDVPWHHSPHLAGLLRSDDVQVTLIKDGDHRLSRDQDIVLLLATIATLPQS
jgi:pimeloyl-ACP methyl ester carboxylesterase